MKISKATRWILAIGILAILLISLGVLYGRQKPEQSQLIPNIAEARQDFIKYTTQYATQRKELEVLEARLDEASSRITSVQRRFHQYTESIEINETLFEAADDANVTITELTSSLPEEEKIGIEAGEGSSEEEEEGITFQVFSIEVTAEGEVVALLNFSHKVSQRFSTSDIQSVEIEVPQEDEEGEKKEPGKPSITLSLKIYIYE